MALDAGAIVDGRYELMDRLGEGGMGVVFRARDLHADRFVALKALVGGDFDEQARARFEREAQAAAQLSTDPGFVTVHAWGLFEGRPYYVMELLQGRNLESIVRQFGAMEPERAAYLLEQACDSLSEAHDQGLDHRDVKPANIQVCRMGRQHDFVKVLDFGLVKILAGDAGVSKPGKSRLEIIGTPSYISPEMAAGEEVDARADIYSLGCVAYWLLTGQPVFDGANTAEIVAKHRGTEAVSPGERTG